MVATKTWMRGSVVLLEESWEIWCTFSLSLQESQGKKLHGW